MSNEPVRTGAIITAVMSVIATLIAFGLIEWTDTQVSQVEAMLVAVLPVLLGVINTALAEIARRRVTPLANAKDDFGVKLVRELDGQPPFRMY